MLFADPVELAPGLMHWPRRLGGAVQESLLDDIRAVVQSAPLFVPRMPKTGKPFSVRMTNCGSLGWVADEKSYRYQSVHPETGQPWPPIPERLRELWSELSQYPRMPEACLVNFYETSARMGLHQDKDEADFDAPVLSVSLGDTCLFRFGGTDKTAPTRSVRLESGDVLLLGGASRLCYHGVDRLYPGSSGLLRQGGRINLTLRVVT